MDIFLATDAWHPQVNGVVGTLSQTIEQLQKMGHSVKVAHPGYFVNIPLPFYSDIRVALPFHHQIRRILGDKPPNYVHIATEGPVGWAVRSYCLKMGWSFTTAFHTQFPMYLDKFYRFPAQWTWAALRTFHSKSACVMVATQTMQSELHHQGFASDRISLWGRGVDTHRFQPKAKSARSLPIALYVGRVSAEKSIEDFLRVNRPLTKWVVGDGPERAKLQKKFPQVTFFGWQHGEALAQTYAQADVFVFPSKTDTFGLVMIEAMASGVPVAAYPVQGPLDVVVPGTGVFHLDLETAINGALLCDPFLCRKQAKTYSWEKCTQQFLNNLISTCGSLPKGGLVI